MPGGSGGSEKLDSSNLVLTWERETRLKEEKALRPMIAHLTDEEALTEFIGKHLFERNVFYQKATTVYPIDGLSVEEIVKGLLSTLA